MDRLHEGGGALVVSGEAGIGKSAMLGHVREHAGTLGFTVLATVGAEFEAELGFAGLHQLLFPIIGSIELLPDAQRMALEAAFGEATGVDPDPFRVAIAAFRLVSDTADSIPVVLLVDDAHWLDRPSLGVLTFIGRRLEHVPAALVATVRAGDASPFKEFDRLQIVELGRLSAGDAGTLLDRSAPGLHPVSRARVLAEAAGNPLALVELPRTASFSAVGPIAWSQCPRHSTPDWRRHSQRAFATSPARAALLSSQPHSTVAPRSRRLSSWPPWCKGRQCRGSRSNRPSPPSSSTSARVPCGIGTR